MIMKVNETHLRVELETCISEEVNHGGQVLERRQMQRAPAICLCTEKRLS